MPDNMEKLLQSYRKTIERETGQDIKEMILYGSYARGDFRKDSDIDIMILADTDETGLKQLESKVMDITYDFNWDHGTEIMPAVQDIKHFNYWKKAYLFYRNVEEEGVLI